MTSETILIVSNVSVRLAGRSIIDDLSFTVARGEVLTVVGPNGAGKTVILKTLLGLIPHAGTIEWHPQTRIGYVPQRLPYIKEIPMTVEDFLELKRCPVFSQDEVLKSFGFTEKLLSGQVGELSSGQFQKVLIAWSLLGNPDVLLFDEPTTGIDIAGEESVYGLLEKLQRERNLTMVLVTHDLSIVYRLSTTVLCLNQRLVCHGPPRDVLTTESLQQLYDAEVGLYIHKHA